MRTLLAVCLDESGSMDGAKRTAAISAFNEYLADQKKLKADECLLTLTKFNYTAWTMVPLTPIAEVQPLSEATYIPSGGTALLDAVSDTIHGIEKHILHSKQSCGECGHTRTTINDRVVVVILTDGEENSSKHTTIDQVKSMIRSREATDHWTFVFLSASPNAWQQGAALGINQYNTIKLSDTPQGVYSAARSMSLGTSTYRHGAATTSAAFFAETPKDPNLTTANDITTANDLLTTTTTSGK